LSWQATRNFAVFLAHAGCHGGPTACGVIVNARGSHRAGWPTETMAMPIERLFYRQLQFNMFAQGQLLSEITLN
jgi:hypothetical protein